MKNSNLLLALTAAASALPSATAQADEIADQFDFGIRYYDYNEDPLTADQTLGPVFDRYDIRVNQFMLVAPLTDGLQVTANYQTEKMSGASPWFTLLDPNGNPVQVMSGATIEDEREDISVNMKYFAGRHSMAFTTARSTEDDYDATSFALEYNMESEDRLATYTFAADVSNDDVYPVDADLFLTRPAEEQSRRSNSFLLGYSQILNKQTVLQLTAGYSERTGYLSDPYKVVFVDFMLLGDSRPESRYATTLSAQLRYFNDYLNGALHADYRYYQDSWEVDSNTFNLAWYQNLGAGFQLVPSIRLYNQSAAYFYDVFYEQARADGFYSTDYRLAEFGAITYGLKLNKSFESWFLTLSFEAYRSGGNTGLANSEIENPALLDFELVSAGFNFRF